ncbi:hypothetical protein GALMADRAFT_713250 [Galerina marginata CBS 339.88]|uniref:Uncharacterized protein n=1 Tax=Galerina marginata (strain CBS 339.88) TaxID=685588 RepID=A0A067TZG8_GALM3|nr:hypothetical protein GALMADRAFT_713250 [Galerina marginata CBS 339.88]
MTYSNPLHPPIAGGYASNYTALAPAVSGGGARGDTAYCKRLPQGVYTPASKWHAATGRTNDVHAPISFNRKGANRRAGVSVVELNGRSIQELSAILEGGDDRVLADTGRQRITFRIMWPGYSQVEWVRSIDIVTGGPITRAKLAQIVAQNFSRFVETHRTVPCSTPEFQVGPNAIRSDHLYLVSLNNAFEDSWQAEVVINLR